MAKKKHEPPAKHKYDKSHPIVSIRVDLDLKKKLEEINQTSGKSVGDILREAVGAQGKSTKKAYEVGFAEARRTYGVRYRCAVCGGVILMGTDAEKEAAAQFMREHRWGHGKCVT